MKRTLLALFTAFFCETAFAQDYFANDYGTPASSSQWDTEQTQVQTETQTTTFGVPKKTPRRNSFYFNAAIGFDMTNIYYNHRYYTERVKYDGTGYGYTGELTLGMLIKGLIAVHGSIEYLSIDGKYDIDEEYSKNVCVNEIDASVMLFGAGVTAYPFSRSSSEFWQGAFISGKLSVGVIVMNDPFDGFVDYYGNFYGQKSRDSHSVIAFDFEIGKDWQISERAYMGFGIRWQFKSIQSGHDTTDDRYSDRYYHHQHLGNSLQLMLRINRK